MKFVDEAPGKEYYNDSYKNYAAQNPRHKLGYYRDLVERYVPVSDDVTAVDIGCAFGDFLASLPATWRRIGVEVNRYAIAAARERHPGVTFYHASEFNTRAGKADVVTAFDVLEHIPDVYDTLGNIARLLHGGGLLVAVVPLYDGPLGTVVTHLDKDPTHVHKRGRAFWRRLISQHFEIILEDGLFRYLVPGTTAYLHLHARSMAAVSPAIAIVARKRW